MCHRNGCLQLLPGSIIGLLPDREVYERTFRLDRLSGKPLGRVLQVLEDADRHQQQSGKVETRQDLAQSSTGMIHS
jgi:hypothetical protein